MRMTGGEAVVRSLEAHGVDTVFGIPGTHNLGIYDALREIGGIRHISSPDMSRGRRLWPTATHGPAARSVSA